jgi:molybdopterin-containing oxidoreductase family membrane subunit
MLKVAPNDRQKLILPLFQASPGWWGLVSLLSLVVLWGGYMYARQVVYGLGETGMDRPTFWGVYMVNFIFFIGISHAGTLISAILRVTGAEWRRPITRIAEAITVFALMVGSLQILFDLGRPDRLLYLFRWGRAQSPLLWDAMSVTAYFLGSVTYLYLPLIPDLALLRDNLPESAPAWRRKLYAWLALGWRGNPAQWQRLEKAVTVMAVLIIPIAVSVHSIISWILATTVQPGWHSTIFGPYFVVGAIYSGIAALFLAMTTMRRVYRLENYITSRQYGNLGLIFITMSSIWFYFTFSEYLILAAGQQKAEFPVLANKLWGPFALTFWGMVLAMVIAFFVLVFPRLMPARWGEQAGWVGRLVFRPRFAFASALASVTLAWLAYTPPRAVQAGVSADPTLSLLLLLLAVLALLMVGVSLLPVLKRNLVVWSVVASVLVLVGMWLERWNIVVPSLTQGRLIPFLWYRPTLTEWSLTAASVALFILSLMLFFKLFPPLSIWEVMEGRVIEETRKDVTIPLPEPSFRRSPLGMRKEL